ncbi:MAG: glycoside hydrolase [Prolixibacteraceae bacterium]|jgi:polygalacturonase|nr:glycoside hydrolase [Prolixibacteraceae bacterium]MBT6005501.1 glycoside hydrolase [Prolixibacteraceae bacterium]MBT6766116.1 glycoside hydrolase [Prolixibacteraceae bacterium]MBT7000796.1 glycoside hydrolase [Prolixibacteraceae bacterium]MBT7393567.1 glycoside hydrolase [Prolixibacteraceae bacterium]
MRKSVLFIFFVLISTFIHGKNRIYNILNFGAINDGQTINTLAIQNAIDSCSIKGGTVIFPAGDFLTGTLYLKSNVTIHLSENAKLIGSTNIKDYPHNSPEYKFYGDTWVKQSLIYAEKQENIAISGNGTIDGQGWAFKNSIRKKPDRYMNRPYVLWFVECTNVKVEDIFMTNSAMWMQHYLACNKVRISGIRVFNHCNKNNDMIDIDGCKDVIISDCIGDTDDDALTIKSTSNRKSENIIVNNCILSSHCNAIKCGTESSGGFKNIVISNCIVRPSEQRTVIYGTPNGISGITLGMVDGGILDGININNIIIEGVTVPLYMRLGNRARAYRTDQGVIPVGSFKNVQINNIYATGADSISCSFTGIPGHPIENISLSNIQISFKGGIEMNENLPDVPELETHYPESTMFGILPASALFIRHAKNINLNQIQFSFDKTDTRPALICEDVKNLRLQNISLGINSKPKYMLGLKNCSSVSVSGWKIDSPIETFVKVNGGKSNDIMVYNNNGIFSKKIQVGNDVAKSAIIE